MASSAEEEAEAKLNDGILFAHDALMNYIDPPEKTEEEIRDNIRNVQQTAMRSELEEAKDDRDKAQKRMKEAEAALEEATSESK